MSEKKREIGQTSFSMLDEFEKELWEWANRKEHGKFSPFVKRILVQERERQNSGIKVVEHSRADFVNVDEDREAAKGFM